MPYREEFRVFRLADDMIDITDAVYLFVRTFRIKHGLNLTQLQSPSAE